MSETTIDRATFEALQQTAGAEFVGELVDTFLSEAPLMQQDLRAALPQVTPTGSAAPRIRSSRTASLLAR
jgi:hypothetical protein